MLFLKNIFKSNYKLSSFVLILSLLNFLFFHFSFFKYVVQNIDIFSVNGMILSISLLILVPLLNFLVIYILFYFSKILGKILLSTFFIISSISTYFIGTYGVILDESMIGNVLNTNWDESSSFFSFTMVVFLIVFGIIPCIFIFKAKIDKKLPLKSFFKTIGLILLTIIILVGINAKNIIWIDKNSKFLGGLVMPWSYIVNTSLFYKHKNKAEEKEILLPNLKIKDKEKSVVVLVIGESARKQNFSLYGYNKNTNPLLSKIENLYHFDAQSCSTYTTASLKCILEHTNTNDLYEILPNYLHRNGVEVIWRTSNWGEPPIHIEKYIKDENLMQFCKGDGCFYDEVLLTDLKKQILESKKDKILIILHTSTSHGPTYYKKYPSQFEVFKPVCKSVELGNCTNQELINAYDNTIVYTDYLLAKTIEELKSIPEYKSTMIYVSDHGESLGENSLYMHGIPISVAPKVQYEIPFIVWLSNSNKTLKKQNNLTQNHVFHSVLNFLSLESEIYNEEMNIFKNR